MIVYAAAQKEGIEVSEKEYEEQLDSILTSYGYSDRESFEDAAGMALDQFAEEQYSLKLNLYLEKVLDVIYDRIAENAE